MESFLIKSGSDASSLEFFDRSPIDPNLPIDSFWVRVTDANLSAAVSVYDGYGGWQPSKLFAEMAEKWRGWPGELTWAALEGEIGLFSTQDHAGHVEIAIVLRGSGWTVNAIILTEAGQLASIARNAARFFGSGHEVSDFQ